MTSRLVMETLQYPHATDPAVRIMRTPFADPEKSRFRIVTRENLNELLALHTGPEDVPANTKWAYHDFREVLDANDEAIEEGRHEDIVPIIQYELVFSRRPPEWETNEPLDPEAHDVQLVGPWMLASLTRQRRLAVTEAILQKELTVIHSKRSGRVDQFVVVDDALHDWLDKRAVWCPATRLHLCRWHNMEDLADAITKKIIKARPLTEENRLPGVTPETQEVRLGPQYVEWAMSGMPENERALLLQNRIVDA